MNSSLSMTFLEEVTGMVVVKVGAYSRYLVWRNAFLLPGLGYKSQNKHNKGKRVESLDNIV